MKSPLQLPSTFGVHIEIHEIRAFSFCDSFSLVNITFPFVYPEKFITIRISRQTQFFSLFAENGSATCLRLVKTLPSRDLLLRCQYNVDFNYDWTFRIEIVKKTRETFSFFFLADIKANKAWYLAERSANLADRVEREVGKVGSFVPKCAFAWRVLISTLRRERGTTIFIP